MSSLQEMTARNSAQFQSDFNKRGTQMVREFCSEHTATSHGGTAEIVLGYDTDLSLCTEWQFKLFFTGASNITFDPIVQGNGIYKTYDAWVSAHPEGSYVNTDGSYGAQCWDYGSAFWLSQVNRQLETGNGAAYGCWTLRRDVNAGTEFALITSWSQVKKGDWVIWDKGRFSGDEWGHIAMAAEDVGSKGSALFWGQNQGGTPVVGGGSTINKTSHSSYKFLGVFRYKGWK